uniref:Uncharacterized protein n=1 Tax=Tanacetum cinerariifolium TaxID=118510 RepID=A0A699K0P7_TANCI|nr:hypothetical protein [Tanacetum cinerariifolium]
MLRGRIKSTLPLKILLLILGGTDFINNANKQENPEESEHSIDSNIEFIGSSIPHHLEPLAEVQRKLVKASSTVRPVPNAPILVPYTINGKLLYLTEEHIQAHMDRQDQIRKAEEEARLFVINKPEVIKVVREDAKKLRIHLKEAITTKVGEKFKKARDAKHEVLKKQHADKVKISLELKKHKYDNYMWTISSKLKLKLITDVKIHPKTKPVVIIVFRGINNRNFDVHNPFAFSAFSISELDEMRWNDIQKVGIDALVSYLVSASMVQSPKNTRFNMKLKKLITEHPNQEKLKSKKVKLEALRYEMD